MVGEDAHLKGISGAKRAKLYLEGTMRICGAFANTDSDAWARKLTLAWPEGGQTFSFDLGGSMRGAPYHGDQFCAEVKHYQGPADQGTHFVEFLAKCYVADQEKYLFGDHYMWITWAPFNVNSWSQLHEPQRIESAVVQHRQRIFGDVSEDEARKRIDANAVQSVSERVWRIVLSEKQEGLLPLTEWRAILAHELTLKGEW
ncbi:hypothetical protein AB0P32_08570 [Streptomyces sp. NPDC085995]|uniref:hypothetical protein n=1 Tax=Streptomyces sp. NPDC085995 TaxID=3154861 RepID=UPI00342FC00F